MSLAFFLPFIFSCRCPAASSTSAQWQLQQCEWQMHLLLGDTCQPERPSPQTYQCHWHFCIPKLKEMCMAYESVTVMRLAKYKCHYYNWHALLQMVLMGRGFTSGDKSLCLVWLRAKYRQGSATSL